MVQLGGMTQRNAYQTLIDALVEVSRRDFAGDPIRANGHAKGSTRRSETD